MTAKESCANCGAIIDRRTDGFGIDSRENLVTAYEQLERAFLDALHALNDAGLACPASLGLAIEKARQVITQAGEQE